MTTQELRSYIDRILGNSLRVLLPSYWWKRLFGATLDVVEDVKNTTKTLQKEVDKKATLSETIVLDWSTTELTNLIEGAIYSIPKDSYGNIAETLTINDDLWSAKERVGAADDVAVTVWFKGKTKLSVKKWNEEVTNWLRTPQNLNLSNLDKDKLYRYQRLNVWTSDNSFIPVYTITEYSDGQSWYDSALSETSTNAVQNKVVKAYIDSAVANAGGGSSINELDITNPAQVRDIIAKVREGEHNIYWVGSDTQSSSCLSYHIFDALQLFAITDDIKMYLFDLTGNRLITDKKNRIYIPASRMATNNAQRVKKNSVIYRLIVNNVISGTDCFLYDHDTYKDHQVMECLVRTVGNSTYVDFTTIIDGNKVTFNLTETGQFEGSGHAESLITCDSVISDTSENPVQNKVVKEYVDNAITSAITNTLNTEV